MPYQSCIWSVCSRCVDSAGRIQSSLHTEKTKVNQISSTKWSRHSSGRTNATTTAWRYESLPASPPHHLPSLPSTPTPRVPPPPPPPHRRQVSISKNAATSSPLGPLNPHTSTQAEGKHQQERLRWYPQTSNSRRKQAAHLLPLLFIFSGIRKKRELITLVVYMIYGLVPKPSSWLLICQWYRTQLFKKYNECIRISTKLIEPLQPCGIKKRVIFIFR
jgi:hypothetical protein